MRWFVATRHGRRVIRATLGFPDGPTPNLRRCFTFTVLGGARRTIWRGVPGPFRYFRRYPSGPVTKTPTTPLHEGNASFTDGVRRVMPLKRFLFRSPLPADTYARRRSLLLLLLRLAPPCPLALAPLPRVCRRCRRSSVSFDAT